MQAFLAELTPTSQNSVAHPETLHEPQAGTLTIRGYTSSQPARSGNLLLSHAFLWAVSVPVLHLLQATTVHSFQTALILKALNMMVTPTEAVRSLSSFNWIALMHIASGYSIHKPTVRGCPNTRVQFLAMKANQHRTLQTPARTACMLSPSSGRCPARRFSPLLPRHSADARGRRCAVPG